MNVQKGEVSSSTVFGEWVSLNQSKYTILVVSSLRNCSKSRALPLVPSLISWSNLKTSSYLWSRPRTPPVKSSSLISALLWRGSAYKEKRAWSSLMWSGLKIGFFEPMSFASTVLSSFCWIYFFDMDLSEIIKYKLTFSIQLKSSHQK